MYNSNNFLLQKVAAKMALDQNKISSEEFNLLIKRLEKREEEELLERETREKLIKEATNNLYHRYSTV
jgi:hypothetical protein